MKSAATVFFLILSPCLLAETFLPPNSLKIPSTVKNTGLGEERYHAVINRVEKYFAPRVRRLGAELKIERKWESDVVNAGTFRDENGKHWHINLYGGFARHDLITDDGYTLVICHELGHHLGGAPKKKNTAWSSNEGQADYYASLKCFRQIHAYDDNLEAIKDQFVPSIVKENCEKSFWRTQKRALCIRNNLAAQAVANVLYDTLKLSPPNFDTPDPQVAVETIEKHPRSQCRLDTYFQASLCGVGQNISLSSTDELKGACHPDLGHEIGTRPLCWFRPKKEGRGNPLLLPTSL